MRSRNSKADKRFHPAEAADAARADGEAARLRDEIKALEGDPDHGP